MSGHQMTWLAGHCARCGAGVMFALATPRELPDPRCPACAADELGGMLAGAALRLRFLINGIERRRGIAPTKRLEWALAEIESLFEDLTGLLEP